MAEISAQVSTQGVNLRWKVDEGQAHRITGFSCVYRTPSHLSLGVSGAVPCSRERSGADARSLVVVGLPEFGDYDFEVVADVGPGEAIEWPLRALRIRVAVTEEFAGPAGSELAVTGAGPMVAGCSPGDGPGDAPAEPPWQQSQIVSAAHLTHYPGSAWTPGGDPDRAPEWPEPLALDELFEDAGLDGQVIQQALTDSADAGDVAETLADVRAVDALAHASATTKALLRPSAGAEEGWELRLHTSYPFGADYLFDARHAVAGWGHGASPAAGAMLYLRTDCPPPDRPDATHDLALAVSDDAGHGRRLQHSGYGWWAVAPVAMFPQRIVATKAGLSFGEPATAPPTAPATYTGRASGHLFAGQQRYSFAGDLTLSLERAGGTARLAGRIDNVVTVPLHHDSLSPRPGSPAPYPSLVLEAAPARGPGWRGAASVARPAPGAAQGEMLAPEAFEGDWEAQVYGPNASEIAGRLRLWTPLPAGADPAVDWPAQAVIVAGFAGAAP